MVRCQRGHRAVRGRPLRDGRLRTDPGGAKFVEFEPGRKATLRFADADHQLGAGRLDGKTRLTLYSVLDLANPPYPGWAGWLSGIAGLRRYHELPRLRSIWRQIEVADLPRASWRSTNELSAPNAFRGAQQQQLTAHVLHPGRQQRMASLVLKMSVSLDGCVAPVDGSTDWVAAGRSDDALRWTVETVSNAGAHLMGATTYAGWAGYWPGASGPFAADERDPQGRVRLARGPPTGARRRSPPETWPKPSRGSSGALRRIPARPRRGTVRPTPVETGLIIDEYRLVIHPVVREGERIFMEPLTIEPMSTTALSGGAVAHVCGAPVIEPDRQPGSADAVTSRYDGPGKRLQNHKRKEPPVLKQVAEGVLDPRERVHPEQRRCRARPGRRVAHRRRDDRLRNGRHRG